MEWTKTLSVGDQVGIIALNEGMQVGRVERLTPTQITVGGQRYSRKNGNGIGKVTGLLIEATPRLLAYMEQKEITNPDK